MKEIALAKGGHAIVDDDIANFIGKFRWTYAQAKGKFQKYARASIYDRKEYQAGRRPQFCVAMHHLVVGYPMKGMNVDHVNGNSLDNRRENLRVVTIRQNGQNKNYHRGEKTKSSKFMGVCWDKSKKKWLAKIYLDHAQVNLGRYAKEEDAAKAYQDALGDYESKSASLSYKG